MTTKDFIVFIFMTLGVILFFLVGLGIVDHYHDLLFLPLGLAFWLTGRIIDRFWKSA